MGVVVSNYLKNQYYKDFYRGNDNARSTVERESLTSGTLIKADSTAMKRAVSQLTSLYKNRTEEGLDGRKVYGAVLAFGDTYNNLLDSASGSTSHRAKNLAKSIKSLSSQQKSDLEAIGIKVKGSGKISIDKEALQGASARKVEKVFGEDSDFTKALEKYARSLGSASKTIDLQA